MNTDLRQTTNNRQVFLQSMALLLPLSFTKQLKLYNRTFMHNINEVTHFDFLNIEMNHLIKNSDSHSYIKETKVYFYRFFY
jgi:hypothetical protein